MTDNIARNFKRGVITCLVGVFVFAVAIALSVALTLHLSDQSREQRVNNRAVACQQAKGHINPLTYNATGCPQILKEAGQ